jgi:hypothetical protein
MFASNSRYLNVPDGVYTDASGRQISYKLLRLTPDAPTFLAHSAVQQDRLDLLAFQYYRDPEQFWRICDANLALRPDDLLQPGVQVLIPQVQR